MNGVLMKWTGRLLLTIIDKFEGGPVGLETLAAALNEEKDTLEDVYEPFLIQEGFLDRTPRGRQATRLAYEYFGRKSLLRRSVFCRFIRHGCGRRFLCDGREAGICSSWRKNDLPRNCDRSCKAAPSSYREQQEHACTRVIELTRSAK